MRNISMMCLSYSMHEGNVTDFDRNIVWYQGHLKMCTWVFERVEQASNLTSTTYLDNNFWK
jgi:hypothetical protein